MSIYALNLLRELVAAGHEVTLISQYYGGAHAGVYGGGPPPPVPGVRVIGLEAEGEQAGGDFEADIAAMVKAIGQAHARTGFDVLHAQYAYPTGWAALLAARATGVPVLVSIQGGDGHWVGSCCETHRLAMVRTLAHAGALLIGGASFAGEVAERLGTDPARFTIVPGAVDTGRFRPAEGMDADGSAERGAEAGPSGVRLLYHGRVDRRKGVLDFIEALAGLDRAAGWRATISGIGPDLQAAQAMAAAHGLGEPALRFTGYLAYEDAPALYRAHDVFVSPTYSEGFSNTILEAMASGLPVLSCNAVGVRDCLRHEENGLLVRPGDVPALRAALLRLMTDAALRRRLAETALAECRRVYSWRAVGGAIMDQYARLAGTTPDGAFEEALPMTPCRFRANPALL